MAIETSIILPGGWHYNDPSGYRIPLKGELPNPKTVIDQLLSYRLENNIAPGNPGQDLEDYVCAEFPTWCRRGTQPPPISNVPKTGRNVDLVIAWANELYIKVGRLTLIPQGEAEERANTCANCPVQMNWAQDCPPCVTSAQRLLTILRQGKDTSLGNQGRLLGCAAHGWDNRTVCHMDKQHLPPQPNSNAPAECWMRK